MPPNLPISWGPPKVPSLPGIRCCRPRLGNLQQLKLRILGNRSSIAHTFTILL